MATVPFQQGCADGGGGTGEGGTGPPPGCLVCDVYGFRSAYPNAADQELTVEDAAGSLTLYNSLGRPVRELPASRSRRVKLDTRALPAGTYFLEVTTPSRVYHRQRISVQH